jgi:hypothetical protein
LQGIVDNPANKMRMACEQYASSVDKAEFAEKLDWSKLIVRARDSLQVAVRRLTARIVCLIHSP